jgi:hypothetical protein
MTTTRTLGERRGAQAAYASGRIYKLRPFGLAQHDQVKVIYRTRFNAEQLDPAPRNRAGQFGNAMCLICATLMEHTRPGASIS